MTHAASTRSRPVSALALVCLLLGACHEPLLDLGGYGGDSCAESYYPRSAWECESPSGCCFAEQDDERWDAGRSSAPSPPRRDASAPDARANADGGAGGGADASAD